MASSAYTAPTESPLKANCTACVGDSLIFQPMYATATRESRMASNRAVLRLVNEERRLSPADWPSKMLLALRHQGNTMFDNTIRPLSVPETKEPVCIAQTGPLSFSSSLKSYGVAA